MSAAEKDRIRLPMSDEVLAAWEFALSGSDEGRASVWIHWSKIRGFIDRIRTADEERDEAMRRACLFAAAADEREVSRGDGKFAPMGPRQMAEHYYPEHADRLFPPEVPK